MSNLNTYIESFKMKYDSFIVGCDSVEELGLWDKENLGEMDAFYSNNMSSLILRVIAIDGKITQKEVEYLNKSFGFNYTLNELTQVYDICKEEILKSFEESFENSFSYLQEINPKLAEAYKELIVLICEIIIKSDDVVSPSEISEVECIKAKI
ncbi:MAG: TerB family tellurite resistance protein [Ruminococcaceae bacterium]|nr:TerB family tellurite resistance protein [Oscillospiraceae bacterium]